MMIYVRFMTGMMEKWLWLDDVQEDASFEEWQESVDENEYKKGFKEVFAVMGVFLYWKILRLWNLLSRAMMNDIESFVETRMALTSCISVFRLPFHPLG